MSKTTLLTNIGTTLMKHKTSFIVGTVVLAGVGIAGAVITAVKAQPKVTVALKKEEEKKGRELKKTEKVVVVAKTHWKSIAIGLATLIFIAGVMTASAKAYGALAANLAVTEGSLISLKSAVDEVADAETKEKIEKKCKEKEHETLNNYLNNNPNQVYKFIFDWDGAVWYGTKRKLDSAFNKMNRCLNKEDDVSVMDIYDDIEAKGYGSIASNYGWRYRDIEGWEEIWYSEEGKFSNDTGEMEIHINFDMEPADLHVW